MCDNFCIIFVCAYRETMHAKSIYDFNNYIKIVLDLFRVYKTMGLVTLHFIRVCQETY
jgi:hypothetical protein